MSDNKIVLTDLEKAWTVTALRLLTESLQRKLNAAMPGSAIHSALEHDLSFVSLLCVKVGAVS